MHNTQVTTLAAQVVSSESENKDQVIIISVSVAAILIVGTTVIAICVILTRLAKPIGGSCSFDLS